MSRRDLELIVSLREQGHIPDRAFVIDIGAQQLSNSVLRARTELEKLGRLFGVESAPPLPAPLPSTPEASGYEPLLAEAPFARELWRWLGVTYASIDIAGSPDALELDLNYDVVPHDLADKHQVVMNFGTTEHVANQVNAFKIVHDLAALGGVMIHNLPCQGGFNHGLVNYTPKFFWTLARGNNYRWLNFRLSADPVAQPLPDNLIDSIRPFNPQIDELAARYRVSECSIVAVFQKRDRAPFVAPFDGPATAAFRARGPLARCWSVLRGGA